MRSFRGGSVAFAILLAFACDSSINPNGVEKVATIGKLALTTKAVSLIVGQERQLSVFGNTYQVTWQSDNADAVTVSPTGLVSGRAPGIAHVVVRQQSSADTTVVTVRAGIDNVQILNDSVEIAVGQTARLTFRATDSTGAFIEGADFSGVPARWSSSRPSIATVDSIGLVSAAAVGQAAIVLSVGDKTDTAIVNVVPLPVAQVVLSAPAQFSISVGSSYKIAATARDAAGNDLPGRAFAWSSSDATVASVSQTGVIAGIAPGSAQITVLSEGQTAHVNVIVSPPSVAGVIVSLASGVIDTGQTTQAMAVARDAKGNALTGRSVVWSSSGPSATISNSGIVKGIIPGSAVITATVDGVVGSVMITVGSSPNPPASGVLATHDFEDGTLGPYYNPWGTAIDVIADPTGGGHGKVSRFHYAAASLDDNKAIVPKTGFAVGLGDSIFFRGQFYLPSEINTDPNFGLRKLTYWSNASFKEEFSAIITLVGQQLVVVNTVVGPSNLPIDFEYTPTIVAKGVWHTLETQLKVNSSFSAKDGVFRVWLDGALVYDRTNMRWSDPLWTEAPDTYKWEMWGIGYQMNSPSAFDEYRYWDNLTFGKAKITP